MVQAGNLYEQSGYNCASGPVDINPQNRHAFARPDENYVAVGLTAGLIVARSAVVLNQIALAGNADAEWRGVLIEDQLLQANGIYNRDRPLTYTTDGQIRCLAGEALADDTLVCSDATGRLRPWVVGVDAAMSLMGRTKSSCTAAGEWVEMVLNEGG